MESMRSDIQVHKLLKDYLILNSLENELEDEFEEQRVRELNQKISEVVERIGEQNLYIYNRKKIGKVRGRSCGNCYQSIPTQILINAEKFTHLEFCPNCGCIIIVENA